MMKQKIDFDVMSSQCGMYEQMMDLVTNNEAFYFQDYEKNGFVYRVFNYRLASYSDFLNPIAREMRGITWVVGDNSEQNSYFEYAHIVSRPFEKFFNWEENPLTTGLDLSKATAYEEKADGSLIATYWNKYSGMFGLKSKQAFFSEQAQMAGEWLYKIENSQFKEEVIGYSMAGCTVLMELCSPANRIVLEYPTTHLRVHGIRNNITGEYINKYSLKSSNPLYKAWVDRVEVDGLPDTFIASTALLEGIEGYVVHGPWGRFKIKTDWYRNLHHLKDSISTTKRLIEAIIFERVDDVRAMFSTDEFTLKRIMETEARVVPVVNHIMKTTQEFYEANKYLDRKSYAIKGQDELKDYFSLGMNLYLGKEVDYKTYCMKYAKELFNLGDEESEIGEE